MLEKAKKANPATLVKICNSMVDDISQTLSLDQMVSLAKDVILVQNQQHHWFSNRSDYEKHAEMRRYGYPG